MPNPISWSHALPYFTAAFVVGYLLGSIPFGLLFTKAAGLGDLRGIGSGNIGATNVLRTGNRAVAAATLLADMLKGTVAVLLGLRFGIDTAVLAGVGSFFGHVLPVWLKFRGGKGVATFIGIQLGLFWPAALIFCAVWLTVAVLTRYSSLSALVASVLSPLWAALFDQWQLMEVFAFLAVIVVITHRANIGRLIRGEEAKIRLGRKEQGG